MRHVSIEDQGRSGSVIYHEAGNRLACYWEYGGGNVVAFVQCGKTADWATRAAEARWVFRLTTLRMYLGLVVLAGALLVGAGLCVKSALFAIDPGKGTALGYSVRTDRNIATSTSPPEPERFLECVASGESDYLDAALLCPGHASAPIRLDDPPGALMLYTSMPGPQGTAVVARVDETGKEMLWSVDRGIGRFALQQILPERQAVCILTVAVRLRAGECSPVRCSRPAPHPSRAEPRPGRNLRERASSCMSTQASAAPTR